MRRVLFACVIVGLLVLAGCLKYYGRSELPKSITVEKEKAKCDIGCLTDAQCQKIEGCSPNMVCNKQTGKCEEAADVECKAATCMAIAQQQSQRNVRWECSPPFKGTNDDPQGNKYYSLYGDSCKELELPDTLCLEYDCAGDSALYYAGDAICPYEGNLYAHLTLYPAEKATNGNYYVGIGSMGKVKLGPGDAGVGKFVCNAVSSEERSGEYRLDNCGVENGCRTCAEGGVILIGSPAQCKAAMPIEYPYNTMNFKYNPIVDAGINPSVVIRDLSVDYKRIGSLDAYYKDAQKGSGIIKECENVCSQEQQSLDSLADEGIKSSVDACNECTQKEVAKKKAKIGSDANDGISERGYSFEELAPANACEKSETSYGAQPVPCCSGLAPCVEIDRAINGSLVSEEKCLVYRNATNHSQLFQCSTVPDKCEYCEKNPGKCECVNSKSVKVCDKKSLNDDGIRYFVCQCACAKPIYATYECTRPGDKAKYYYTQCERTADTTSQGGYLYEVHNFTGGMFKALLESRDTKIPLFMIGQGPTFDDYVLARSLCKPSEPADVSITAGGLPFDPNAIIVREGSRLCFNNMGASKHTIKIASSDVEMPLMASVKRELVAVPPGESVCLPVGPNTKINKTYSVLWLDNNTYAHAEVVLEKSSANIGGRNIVKLLNGKPVFLYDGYIEMDPMFASGYMEGYVPPEATPQIPEQSIPLLPPILLNGIKIGGFSLVPGGQSSLGGVQIGITPKGSLYMPGNVLPSGPIKIEGLQLYPVIKIQEKGGERITLVNAPAEYTDYVDDHPFTYVAYADGTVLRMVGSATSPWFLPGAIQVAEGSKLCVRNEVPNVQKTILLEKKLNYTGTYFPVEAKSSYYGLECCFDLPGPGIYRISDYQIPGNYGYAVVYPASLISTIRIGDYAYMPPTSLSKIDDLVCIENPVNINRTLTYDSTVGVSGEFKVPALGRFCSYNFTRNDGTYNFVDTDTGGKFTLYVNTTDVFRLDVYATTALPVSGRIGKGGYVCIKAVDSDATVIGPIQITKSSVLASTSAELLKMGAKAIFVKAYDMHCFTMSNEGIYLMRHNESGANVIVVVGPPNVGYIVDGKMIPSYLEMEIPLPKEITGASSHGSISVTNLDDYNYTVYNELNIYDSGFATSYMQPFSPCIIVKNNLNRRVSVNPGGEIDGYGNITKFCLKPMENRIKLEGDFKQNTTYVDFSSMFSRKMVIFEPGKTNILEGNVTSAVAGYYGDVPVGYRMPIKWGGYSAIPTQFRQVGLLIVKPSGKSAREYIQDVGESPLDFGVQVISGVPDEDTLMKAREMLAYHQSLPVFLYSRVGDSEVALKNPTEEENYSVAIGSRVNITLDDVSASAVPSPEVPCSELKIVKVDGFFLSKCVRWEFDMADKEIVFTLTKGSATKKINLKPVKPVQELNFSYDEYAVSSPPSGKNYALSVQNLAVEPRAVMLRPDQADLAKYCTMITAGQQQAFDIVSNDHYTAYNMELYSVPSTTLDAVENHDKYIGTARKLADIELLPNMGYTGIKVYLDRPYADQNTITALVPFMMGNALNYTYAKLYGSPLQLAPGLISNLNYTKSAYAVRLFSSQAGTSKNNVAYLTFEVRNIGDYSVLLRRLPLSPTWDIKDELFSNYNAWRGSIVTNKSRSVYPQVWWNYATQKYYPTAGPKEKMYVPFNMTGTIKKTKDFSYAWPILVAQRSDGNYVMPLNYSNEIDYIRSSTENGAPSYPILPQIVGNISVYQDGQYLTFQYPLFQNYRIILVSNGELIIEGGLRFTPGQLNFSEDRSKKSGPKVEGWVENNGTWAQLPGKGCLMSDYKNTDDFDGYDSLEQRICDTGKNDYCELEIDFSEECKDDVASVVDGSVFYSQFGTLCGTLNEFCNGTPGCLAKPTYNSGSVWWCRSNPAPFGHHSDNVGIWVEVPKNASDKLSKIVATPYASEPYYNKESIYDFVDQPLNLPAYYEYVLPGFDPASGTITSNCSMCKLAYSDTTVKCECTGSYMHPGIYAMPRYGGIPVTAFTGGLLYLINDIESATDKFAPLEYSGSKIVEHGRGYVLTETFTVKGKSGVKVMCYGKDTYNGIQDIIPSRGVKQYAPEVIGTYDVYEAAYYASLVGSYEIETIDGPFGPILVNTPTSTFSHISPFVKSLSDTKLGNVKYSIPTFKEGVRQYRNYSTDVSRDVVNISLYNMTVNVIGDEIVMPDGAVLNLNNIGPDTAVWYFGKIDPCGQSNDLQKLLSDRMNAMCFGKKKADGTTDYADCINNYIDYSISPKDIDTYLNSPARMSSYGYSRKSIPSGSSQSLPLILKPKEKAAKYMLYNPQSGKRIYVRVERLTMQVSLNMNTFDPPSISITHGATTGVCITNTDYSRSSRTLVTGGTSPEKITLSKGERKCISAEKAKNGFKDELTSQWITPAYGTVADNSSIMMLANITKAISVPKAGYDNTAYERLQLNPRAPATPAIITAELVSVDGLVELDVGKSYAGNEIELLAPIEVPPIGIGLGGGTSMGSTTKPNSHIKYPSGSGVTKELMFNGLASQIAAIEITCRQFKGYSGDDSLCDVPKEVNGAVSENIPQEIRYMDYSQEGCCCYKEGATKICNSTIPKDQCKKGGAAQCTESADCTYSYYCPRNNTVRLQRCISTLPFYIHVNGTKLTSREINAMKETINETFRRAREQLAIDGEENESLDLIGFVIVIDDPGPKYRGQCKLTNYLDGIRNVSEYAIKYYDIPSIILGFGLNRNLDERQSCWSHDEIMAQVQQLYEEDFIMLAGSGIIGMGQYCLIDGACTPVSTYSAGNDYGLYYTTSSFYRLTFDTSDDNGIQKAGAWSFQSSLHKGTSPLFKYGNLVDINGHGTGQPSFMGSSGLSQLFGGSYMGVSGLGSGVKVGGSSIPGLSGIGGDSGAGDIDPSKMLPPNTYSKDPYTRAWFDQCGRYYYGGVPQSLLTFSDRKVAEGQEGTQCDGSKMMALYKKYKCK